ncbi:hypothetical protein EIM44_03040 [Bibersteinia trehalosi]|uniref:Uncharacterized protein n=1 Tax=Bibersteinia trehalosi TaxID=47735 RepID=A0A426FIM8_BIBTR|nr:hypothetical protein [Bibersteinia trehalosi]RRN04433.1 hypothetical protein EIM44_03040 [Bibersteinia trehalosi]
MSNHKNEPGYLEVKCTNNKCQKTTIFRIAPERCNCSECNTPLPLKRAPIRDIVKEGATLIVAATVGYAIADAPEIFQTKEEIIKIHEAMNACMKYANNYSKQRDICACAFAETYENYKFLKKIDVLFEENKSKCQ